MTTFFLGRLSPPVGSAREDPGASNAPRGVTLLRSDAQPTATSRAKCATVNQQLPTTCILRPSDRKGQDAELISPTMRGVPRTLPKKLPKAWPARHARASG
jgi:hypothetical protein